MKAIRLPLLLLTAALVFIGCSDQGDEMTPPVQAVDQPTWENSINTLLTTNCLGCHSNSAPQSGFSVEDYTTLLNYQTTSGNPLIVSGSPETSELYLRLTGDGFTKMPLLGTLEEGEIQEVYDWIDLGAPENDADL